MVETMPNRTWRLQERIEVQLVVVETSCLFFVWYFVDTGKWRCNATQGKSVKKVRI